MTTRSILLAACIALAATTSAHANPGESTSAAVILKQQAEIRAGAMARSGRFKGMSDARRDTLFEHQRRVTSRLEGVENTLELNENDRIAVFNALEAIEALINDTDGERMICQRHKPAGSNLPTTVCRSAAQRKADNEDAEVMFQKTR